MVLIHNYFPVVVWLLGGEQKPEQKEEVRVATAEYLFAQKDMLKAAKKYAETKFSFEEVWLCVAVCACVWLCGARLPLPGYRVRLTSCCHVVRARCCACGGRVQVALKFINANRKDALQAYILYKLKLLGPEVRGVAECRPVVVPPGPCYLCAAFRLLLLHSW